MRFAAFGEPRRMLVEEPQLVGEFAVQRRIGKIAPRRHIDIVDFGAVSQRGDGMAAILPLAPVAHCRIGQGHAADDGDAVIPLHAVPVDMMVAKRLQRGFGKGLVRRLGFLQAQDIGRGFGQQAADEIDAQPYRVDVPGGDTHMNGGLEGRRVCRTLCRARERGFQFTRVGSGSLLGFIALRQSLGKPFHSRQSRPLRGGNKQLVTWFQ